MLVGTVATAALVLVVAVAGRSDKTNCHDVLDAIDRYTADQKSAPRSAQDLIDRGYLQNAAGTEACANWGR